MDLAADGSLWVFTWGSPRVMVSATPETVDGGTWVNRANRWYESNCQFPRSGRVSSDNLDVYVATLGNGVARAKVNAISA